MPRGSEFLEKGPAAKAGRMIGHELKDSDTVGEFAESIPITASMFSPREGDSDTAQLSLPPYLCQEHDGVEFPFLL
jgi:hypothetical protein